MCDSSHTPEMKVRWTGSLVVHITEFSFIKEAKTSMLPLVLSIEEQHFHSVSIVFDKCLIGTTSILAIHE